MAVNEEQLKQVIDAVQANKSSRVKEIFMHGFGYNLLSPYSRSKEGTDKVISAVARRLNLASLNFRVYLSMDHDGNRHSNSASQPDIVCDSSPASGPGIYVSSPFHVYRWLLYDLCSCDIAIEYLHGGMMQQLRPEYVEARLSHPSISIKLDQHTQQQSEWQTQSANYSRSYSATFGGIRNLAFQLMHAACLVAIEAQQPARTSPCSTHIQTDSWPMSGLSIPHLLWLCGLSPYVAAHQLHQTILDVHIVPLLTRVFDDTNTPHSVTRQSLHASELCASSRRRSVLMPVELTRLIAQYL